ncbi:MAG: hypothetical protein E7135_03430 [Rikenellaceae bacterium]|nr:hypothetical protein [Rikenellaceae bacterium]
MKLENIKHSAERLNSLIDGWNNSGSVPRIERDLALDELRKIYDQLLDIDAPTEAESAPAAPVIPVVAVAEVSANEVVAPVEENEQATFDEPIAEEPQAVEDAAEDDDDVLDIDALLGLTVPVAATVVATEAVAAEVVEAAEETVPAVAEPEPEVTPEPEVIAEPEVEVTPEVEDTPVADAVAAPGALFAVEDIPVAKRSGRTMISLYNTAGRTTTSAVAASADGDDESTTVPIVESEPQTRRLADVLGGDRQVLAEKMASEEKTTTPFNRITDLRKAIGLNDKFLMIKDLFGGNAAQYEATIDTLNEFDDLDDCMIYIVENFSWNPDSEGAKLLVSLIERKLS